MLESESPLFFPFPLTPFTSILFLLLTIFFSSLFSTTLYIHTSRSDSDLWSYDHLCVSIFMLERVVGVFVVFE